MVWDTRVFSHWHRARLMWPDDNDPAPIVRKHHHLGRAMKYDCMLDEDLFWQLSNLLEKLELGISWLQRAVTEPPIEIFPRRSKV